VIRKIIFLLGFLTVQGLHTSCSPFVEKKEINYTQFVDPFIGTQNEGHCFPGATTPLGMVQPSPESYNEYYEGYEMDHVAGY